MADFAAEVPAADDRARHVAGRPCQGGQLRPETTKPRPQPRAGSSSPTSQSAHCC